MIKPCRLKRRGCVHCVEFMVIMAIVATLIGLLLPAMKAVVDSSPEPGTFLAYFQVLVVFLFGALCAVPKFLGILFCAFLALGLLGQGVLALSKENQERVLMPFVLLVRAIEGPAHAIGVGCTQRWSYRKTLLLGVAVVCSVLTMWSRVTEVASSLEISVSLLLLLIGFAYAWMLMIVLVLAQGKRVPWGVAPS